MRRTALAVVVVLVASFGAAIPAGAAASIVIDPSNGLVDRQMVHVSGSGFAPNATLDMGECKAGPFAIEDCDTTSVKPLHADATGAYALDFEVRSTVNTTNGPVDCTVADAVCAVGVADATDIEGTAVLAPISFAPLGPPQRGAIHVPAAPAAAEQTLPMNATGWTPAAAIDAALCAPHPSEPDDCASAIEWEADPSGAFFLSVFVSKTLETGNGDSIDCTVDGACVYAAWDTRDFTATVTTKPTRIAPEIPGTLAVTPATGLRDGQNVEIVGTGWPAATYLALWQCDGPSLGANCGNNWSPLTDGNGTLLATYPVYLTSRGAPCETGACWIVLQWYAANSIVHTAQPISFDTTPVAVTSHYTGAQLAAVDDAANTLGVTNSEVQHLGSWGLAWVLGITHTGTITPAPDSGPQSLTTNWPATEYGGLTEFAVTAGTTPAEFQKTGALFLAYVLALS